MAPSTHRSSITRTASTDSAGRARAGNEMFTSRADGVEGDVRDEREERAIDHL
ncbi:hypothetical protein ABZ070_01005 [Streptomyces sp. NPDC006283]|uniref:hypothetical protein n=1 Tax=Streptomyces sp. NPDC006283 TaxID=3156741 RepID=UPI0033A794C4